MIAFKSHPSVRIKGTENNYEPILCEDNNCMLNHNVENNLATPHLHCPFCSPMESYQDPVILKAHYRVKHVDKGIEFAGLKIVRCCNTCDIVGSIKGNKEFKGAHWHCYRCKNGFNRRDEAMKHYKTHFRNPQTTFQIQISQDVNQDLHALNHIESEQATEILRQENIVTILHPSTDHHAQLSAVCSSVHSSCSEDSPAAGAAGGNGEMQVSVAANETVDSSPTIMIIAEESDCQDQDTDQSTFVYLDGLTEKEESDELKKTVGEQQQVIANLRHQVHSMEKQQVLMEAEYKTQLDECKAQLSKTQQQLRESERKAEELVQQLNIPQTDNISELVANMKKEHENLLHQQLSLLKQTFNATSLESDLSRRVFYITNMDGGGENGNSGGNGEADNTFVSAEFVTLANDKLSEEQESLEDNPLEGAENMMNIKSEGLEEGSIVDNAAAVFSQPFSSLVELNINHKRKHEEEDDEVKMVKKHLS